MFGFTFKRASTVNPIVSAPPPPNRRPSLSPSSSSPLHLPDIIVSSSSSPSPSARATGGRSRGNLSRVSVSHFDLPSLFKGGGENRSRRYVVEEGGEREGEKVGIGGGVGWIEKFQRRVLGGKMSLALGKRGRGIVQRILPTQFSTESEAGNEEDCTMADSSPIKIDRPNSTSSPSSSSVNSASSTLVRLHVYRINDRLGFYHTGLVFGGREYTFCQDAGICRHAPGSVAFATLLGSVRLGETGASEREFHDILEEMNRNGFGSRDYDVMANSCNSFTAELSRRLLDGRLPRRYPSGVLHQSKLADMLSPVARALDLVPVHQEEDEERAACDEVGMRRRRLRIRGSLRGGLSKSAATTPVTMLPETQGKEGRGKRKSL